MSALALLDLLAKARIEEAVAQGMLDRLPGAGQPLVLADDWLVPEGLRSAYRILMNAGCVPPGSKRGARLRPSSRCSRRSMTLPYGAAR